MMGDAYLVAFWISEVGAIVFGVNLFAVHGLNEIEVAELRQPKVARGKPGAPMASFPPSVIGMAVCSKRTTALLNGRKLNLRSRTGREGKPIRRSIRKRRPANQDRPIELSSVAVRSAIPV